MLNSLSIAVAEPSTPLPTYGTPTSSRKPCMVPSSPKGPCNIGITTSITPRERSLPDASFSNSSQEPSIANRIVEPSGSMVLSPLLRLSVAGSPLKGTNTPARVMPTGTTSYLEESMALRTPEAVATEIECSLDLPPNNTATRIFAMYLFSLRGVTHVS